MQFPKDKMKINTGSYQGRESESGWLILDVKNVDLDGISQVYINLDDIEKLKSRSTQDKDLLEKMRNLLSEP
jgi:hypothetical protein